MNNFLNPEEVLKKIKLKENMIAADFGCGSGGWVIPLAKILEDGKIFALDVLEEPLSALRAKIKLNKILNVKTIQANVEKETELLKKSCDLVLMTNLLFQSDKKEDIFQEASRVLKKNGIILVVDWKKKAVIGPAEMVSPQEIIEIAEKTGFKIKKQLDASTYHYAIIFNKT